QRRVFAEFVQEDIAKGKPGDIALHSRRIIFPRIVTAAKEIEGSLHSLDRVIAGAQAPYGAQVQELQLVIFEVCAAVYESATPQIVLIERAPANVVGGYARGHSGSHHRAARGVDRVH